jgi:tetratricopeptide (TPR) repeat protein
MDEAEAAASPAQYRAFISYSHADSRFAVWLHRRLEGWTVPGHGRLAPIFIDRAELAAGPDLSAQVREALAGSAALIVIASPAARASRWVNQEIALFRELHRDAPVLAALIEGEPAEAFPEILLTHRGAAIEPLAADFREGRDGKRLGLIKIIAGLTGLRLDRLVQRDAQGRQRRVMWITAAALLLSLVLAALLVIALRARSEAERQRAEAEGMVEFMLTDLRDQLKGVGRLDVMHTVNERAMKYYGDQADLSHFSPDSLERRTRVIEAMGEDDENGGKLEAALAKYREIYRITASLLARDPANPDRIFAQAQSENRLALVQNTRGKKGEALAHFGRANVLLERLPEKNAKPQWLRLRSYVAGNLCAMKLGGAGKPHDAIGNCKSAIGLSTALLQIDRDGSVEYDLAFHNLWLGDAYAASGERNSAIAAWDQSLRISEALTHRDPANLLWREQHMEVALHLSKTAHDSGDDTRAAHLLGLADADSLSLISKDPANKYWASFRAKIAATRKAIAS